MRRIVHERTNVKLANDAIVDLVIDFLMHPYCGGASVYIPSLHQLQTIGKHHGYSNAFKRFLAINPEEK